MTAAVIKFDRSIPLWGVMTALATIAATGAGVVWTLAGIAHDVSDVKTAIVSMENKEENRDARVTALEARVVRLESSVGFLEKPRS
jgi:hypothetical protein